jgi:threonine aldolase
VRVTSIDHAVLHDAARHDFGSDNYAGAHPDVLAALAAANGGHVTAYGGDPYTARLAEVLSERFGRPAQVYPVFNGTGANVVGLQAMLPRWGAVLCAETAHINTDENGAPERVGGVKLVAVPTTDGKLTPELVARHGRSLHDEHRAEVGVVSITQSTELGTAYSVEELAAVVDQAHELGLRVHLDGSRLANAAASLGVDLATAAAGADVISLGATKLGAVFGEALVVLDPSVDSVRYLRKVDTQLASKMRFASAQLLALYEGDLWRRLAGHANAMATRLRAGLDGLAGVEPTQVTEANAVFTRLPADLAAHLRERWRFYDWAEGGEVRLMCAWDTTEADVDAFVAAAKELTAR